MRVWVVILVFLTSCFCGNSLWAANPVASAKTINISFNDDAGSYAERALIRFRPDGTPILIYSLLRKFNSIRDSDPIEGSYIQVLKNDFTLDGSKPLFIPKNYFADMIILDNSSYTILTTEQGNYPGSFGTVLRGQPNILSLLKIDTKGNVQFKTPIVGQNGFGPRQWFLTVYNLSDAGMLSYHNGRYSVFSSITGNFVDPPSAEKPYGPAVRDNTAGKQWDAAGNQVTDFHQTDAYVQLDAQGRLLTETFAPYNVAHSGPIELLVDEKDNSDLTLTVGDGAPYGIVASYYKAGKRASKTILHPLWMDTGKGDYFDYMTARPGVSTTDAGWGSNAVWIGDKLTTVIATVPDERLPALEQNRGLLWVKASKDGSQIQRKWLTGFEVNIRSAAIMPWGTQFLIAYYSRQDAEYPYFGRADFLIVDSEGNVTEGPFKSELPIFLTNRPQRTPKGDYIWLNINGYGARAVISFVPALTETQPSVSSRIDTAYNFRDSNLYFFKNGSFLSYDFATKQTSTPKALTIASTWKGVNYGKIDAALETASGQIMFFSNDQFVLYDIAQKAVLEAPRFLKNWKGLPFSSIDAAVDAGNGKIYLFSGGQYVRLNASDWSIDPGYPLPINDKTWPGLGFSRIDDVFRYKNKFYFFSGERYVQYDIATDRADTGYPKLIKDGFKGLVFDQP